MKEATKEKIKELERFIRIYEWLSNRSNGILKSNYERHIKYYKELIKDLNKTL